MAIAQENDQVDEIIAASKLKGLIFKRHMLSQNKVQGMSLFGLAGITYAYFPYMGMHFGKTLSYLGMTSASVAGMLKLGERDFTNAISFTDEGLLNVNVSTGPFTSKDLKVNAGNVKGLMGLGNTDPLDGDLDTNILVMANYEENG